MDVLQKLNEELRHKAQSLLDACQARGVVMRPNEGLRDPLRQAKLWRQSRSTEQIQDAVALLKAKGAPFLADVLVHAGPQSGPDVTGSLPGLSWHQWAEALDCFWLVDGKANWSTSQKIDGVNGYAVYAQEATRIGLVAGGLWKSRKDWPHVQLRAASGPLKVYAYPEIDAEMRRRFGSLID